eukprot:2644400-Pleurochrysis_carterae.AAC.2
MGRRPAALLNSGPVDQDHPNRSVVTDSRLKWQEHLPFFVLAFVLLHLCFAIAFSIQEIITLKLVIGIDALPSLFFFFRMIFLYMAEAANSLNTVK